MDTKKSTVTQRAFCGLAHSLEHAQRMSIPKSENARHEEMKRLPDNFIRPMWILPNKQNKED